MAGRCEDLVTRERADPTRRTPAPRPQKPCPIGQDLHRSQPETACGALASCRIAKRVGETIAISHSPQKMTMGRSGCRLRHFPRRFPTRWISLLPCGRNALLATCRWGFRRHQRARRLDPEAPKWGAFEAIALDEATSRAARSPREVQCWASAASQRVRAPHTRAPVSRWPSCHQGWCWCRPPPIPVAGVREAHARSRARAGQRVRAEQRERRRSARLSEGEDYSAPAQNAGRLVPALMPERTRSLVVDGSVFMVASGKDIRCRIAEGANIAPPLFGVLGGRRAAGEAHRRLAGAPPYPVRRDAAPPSCPAP